MQNENLKRFFVWYVITSHLITYRASRNRFSAISFHDYLHYCGIVLAHFLMKIDLNIISSLDIVFSLCARVGQCDVCTDFTQRIKIRCRCRCKWDVSIEYLTRAIFEKQLCTCPYYHLFKRYVFLLLTKMRTETRTVPSTSYIFDVNGSRHINLPP